MPCRDAAKMAVWRASSVTAAPVTAARAVWSPTIPATSDPARSRNSRVRIRGGYEAVRRSPPQCPRVKSAPHREATGTAAVN